MYYGDDMTVAFHVSATLPVSLNDENYQSSELFDFIASASSQADGNIHEFLTEGLTQSLVPVKPKPNWDTSGYWGESTLDLDPTGSGNSPTYGYESVDVEKIPSVTVPGKIEYRLPSWGGFGLVDYQPQSNGSYGLPSNDNPCVGGAGNKIDWHFIADREGAERKDMYVPTQNGTVVDNSGPTIASGFDVGQHSVDDLIRMGLSQDLVNLLRPYTQMSGSNALNYVQQHPLTLTDDQVAAIDAGAHSESLARVVKSYDNATGREGAFWALPAEAQTVIASVAFQYNGAITRMNFWNDVVNDDWNAAVHELQHFGDNFPTRRNTEANLLNAGIYSQHVNQGSPC